MMDPLWYETCWSAFKYFIILIVPTNYILCISWIIKCLKAWNFLILFGLKESGLPFTRLKFLTWVFTLFRYSTCKFYVANNHSEENPANFFQWSSSLKMEGIRPALTLLPMCQSAWYHFPEEGNNHCLSCTVKNNTLQTWGLRRAKYV